MRGDAPTRRLPRLGFLGLGWIGRHRMQAVIESGVGDVAAIADPDASALQAARGAVPSAVVGEGLEALLACRLDGLVIATPSALHVEATRRALRAGVAVFCQKPLATTAADTRAAVDDAERADRRLGVDFSYRYARALQQVHDLARSGDLGEVFAYDLVFHNAYGPDKSWFYDAVLAGGGCVMDLGSHLVDFLHRVTDAPVVRVDAALFAKGRRIDPSRADVVEDYAAATLDLGDGAVARLACSWRLHAGRDAQIEVAAYGTRAAAVFRNVDGSFYHFRAVKQDGTQTTLLVEPPDAWGGRAIVEWAARLAETPRFDAEARSLVRVAETLDAIYGRSGAPARCVLTDRAAAGG